MKKRKTHSLLYLNQSYSADVSATIEKILPFRRSKCSTLACEPLQASKRRHIANQFIFFIMVRIGVNRRRQSYSPVTANQAKQNGLSACRSGMMMMMLMMIRIVIFIIDIIVVVIIVGVFPPNCFGTMTVLCCSFRRQSDDQLLSHDFVFVRRRAGPAHALDRGPSYHLQEQYFSLGENVAEKQRWQWILSVLKRMLPWIISTYAHKHKTTLTQVLVDTQWERNL